MTTSKDMAPSDEAFFPTIFFRNQFYKKSAPVPDDIDLTSSVAIITGANSGLGLESSRQLLSLGLSHLVMAVRSPERSEKAISRLRAQYPKANIDVWSVDMNSYESVQNFARQAQQQLSRIDFILLNAGVHQFQFGTVPSTGHEETIQVNYLSTVLLTVLLLPVVKAKAPPEGAGRVTLISAALTHVAKFNNRDAAPLLSSFDDPKNFDAKDTYAVSKLLCQMFVYELVERVTTDDVIVNLVCPGFVKGTALLQKAGFVMRWLQPVTAAIFARNVTDGASTYVDAAVVKGKESHGSFLMSWEVTPYPTLLYTEEGKKITERLWNETMAELKFAHVSQILQEMKQTA